MKPFLISVILIFGIHLISYAQVEPGRQLEAGLGGILCYVACNLLFAD